ncbi:uncharacterized protein LOC100158772 [Acyrthosiphon pisum]|uniref:Uncharacterized protein n=1 Tax=Acyrthosiphon pisum TaxID=7029 RepID=A0A8R2A2V4_ACYPI|nr:uncharacterized protein LOC100158772 [Acyrthosiphon pisum]|eukprot:XP_001946971.2 PREDICTED: uncharacterized protein LOC100158772 [Acyrthosiphon pisum]
MPVPNEKNETNSHKKHRRWSLIGILSKKKKLKKSQESVDFCPYDGKINQKVAHNNHLKRSTDCLIEQYTCSPRLIRRCNSLQYTNHTSTYTNINSQSSSNEWKTSQHSVYSSSSSACHSDIGVYRSCGNSSQSSHYIKEEDEQTPSVLKSVPFRCSSEIGYYQYKTNYTKKHPKSYVNPNKLIGKKIPPPPPPRDPNITTVYYFRNNRLMSRESDLTCFKQGSNDNIPDKVKTLVDKTGCRNENFTKEPPRSRRPIQICDVETLSSESENSVPKIQTVEEALQELEDMYNSLGLSDEDLLDRAERRDLPTVHQNMRYQSSDELDCITVKRVLPKTRRSGVPDIISDDMAYRRLNKKESKRQSFIPGSFLLVLPTVYNLDKIPKPSSGEPDITLDDVVFRSQRQHLNFLKISDPQPPFGIPLGPIVSAAPTDYLHAVPEGRYKPSFHPRKIPDTVEDDLAFRSLRKDHKFKTCIDFSFVHRNRFRINDLIPKLDNNRIKNDTHWIIKKRPSDYSYNKKKQVKLSYDDLVDSIIDDNQQNLMVVKINHHKPIMLTGFTFSEANQLSKSLFCTNLLPHEPHKLCLTNDTCITNDALPLKLKLICPLSNERNVNGASPVALTCPKSYHVANYATDEYLKYAAKKTPSASMQFTNLGLTCKSVDNKNQPNFRELIKREYAHRYLRSTDNRSNDGFVVVGNKRERDKNNKYQFLKYNEEDNTCACATVEQPANVLSAIVAEPNTECLQIHSDGPAPVVFESAVSSASKSENRTETSNNKQPCKDLSSSLSTASVPSMEYPNRMPGYLEVCLYITIYIYQLFSVNAYGTFIALIFLITLHLCRRFS